MMNQGGNSGTVAQLEPNSLENRHAIDPGQLQTSSHIPSASGSESISWTSNSVNSGTIDNGIPGNSSYQYIQNTHLPSGNVQDGLTVASGGSASSSAGVANLPQEYNGYTSFSNSSDAYGYGNSAYQGYYNSYQQQTNQTYPQPVGAYQNTGAPYQTLSSFQNTGSYAGSASYSTTYYNPGDYQTAGGYSTSGYSNQTTWWNGGNYANYSTHQYPQYTPDSTTAANSSAAPATSLHYQQHYNKQWADYYNQTEVSCAPGTENLSVASTSNPVCPIPSVSNGYTAATSQLPPSYVSSWRAEPNSSQLPSMQPGAVLGGAQDGYWKPGLPNSQLHNNATQTYFPKPLDITSSYGSFHDQQKTACPQGSNLQHPTAHQVPQNHEIPTQTVSSLDTRRVAKMQIPTNPRIASNLNMVIPKPNTSGAAGKPAYISISLPNTNEKVIPKDTSDTLLKPTTFPKSLRGYVERALDRCKDEKQKAICQTILKEIVIKATADGTLYTRDWDTEPLFALPSGDELNQNSSQSSAPVSLLPKFRGPSGRPKSRWEPLPEEKPADLLVSASSVTTKNGAQVNEGERKLLLGGSQFRNSNLSNSRFPLWDQQSVTKIAQVPAKRQRVEDVISPADNGDTSSDSDKEQSLTAYYSGAIARANSPEERKRRESRSKRFEKGRGHQTDNNIFKPKSAGTGNLYTKRASALQLSKNFEDGGSRAVEDIDWDALTVKGTCQEIEKRYLRLTSAPDPASVRPEEVLEKALTMVQNSQKSYLYKCDQLKSIRQDLTVQRIRNQLTVKVYETHARLALEFGDLPEYNQCQSQLKTLYAEGIEGCHMEFAAYNLLCVILHSNNNRDLVSSMSRLSDETKKDEAVRHALAVRSAVTSGNYVLFFRLYKAAPNLNTCLMDLCVEKMRYKAVTCICRSYRPAVPVSYIAQVLGFTSVAPTSEGRHEKDSDAMEECKEWLKAHGGMLITDNNGEIQLDTRASSSTLRLPEPEDAVAHGDANLAVNDFFTRATL